MAEFYSDLNINKNKLKDAVLKDAVIEPRSTAPSNPNQGQIYYDTTDNNIYRYDGTDWLTYQDELETENGTAVSVDSTPTEDSNNLVTSGGVWAAIQAGGGGGTDLPSQTGHAGDFLTTDGNDTLSWADIPVTSVNGETGAVILDASDVGALPDSTTIPQGTVTSVRVQASSPLQSSTSTEQSTSLNTTISFSSQNKNLVLAGPSSGSTAAAPTFRSLVADDIPTITKSKISDFPTIDSTPTNGNTNNLVSSDGIYDKILDRTKIYTASCSTSASTAAKVATLDDSSGFSLTTGVMIAVRFQYGNSATTPTLRVDSSTTGTAKTIAFSTAYNSRSTGNGTTYNTWGPYETVIFTYDGTYWVNTGSALGIYNAYNKANSIVVPSAADAVPLMDSTAAVGTSTDYAREDHVHPVDTSRAASSHTHGDITNAGDITATAPSIASGDKIIINDESASKITNGPSFGTSTTTYLRNDGSWNTPTDNRDPGYGKIKPGTASSSTSAITANTTAAEASTYNETLTINPGNKWVSVAGSNSSTAGSDTFTIGHSAGLTAKTSYGSTSTTASANGGSITVTDIKYDEAGHITSSTDRTITLSQSTTPASHASTATTYGVGNASNYGHVKLSDSTSSTNGTSNGTAATPAAVKAAYDLTLARTKIYTGSCSTAATTAAKVVTLDDATSFSLTDGVKVAVYFSQGNETTGTTTLNVNNTGAKNVYFYGDDNVGMYYTAGAIYNQWGYGETLIFTYVTNGWFHTPSQYFTDLTYKLANSNKFPSQSGNSGKYLTTNGSSVSWASVDALPSQTGNSGKYLTTNGTTASWANVDITSALNDKITYGTTDLTAGVSPLNTGILYLVYE